MSGNRKLYPKTESEGPLLISKLAIYAKNPMQFAKGASVPKCEFRVFPSGQLIINVEDKRGKNVSHQELDVLAVEEKDLEAAILEFVEQNL
jgi:hypothetical protein